MSEPVDLDAIEARASAAREAFPAWGDVASARVIVSEWLDEDANGFVIPADEWGVALFNSLRILLHETDPAS